MRWSILQGACWVCSQARLDVLPPPSLRLIVSVFAPSSVKHLLVKVPTRLVKLLMSFDACLLKLIAVNDVE
eukprot:6197153-Pleurochrysis_carterae.AAC.1